MQLSSDEVELGSVLVTDRGRRFCAVGWEEYTRKDGGVIDVMRWRGECIVCAAEYEVTSPGQNLEASNSFGVVTCPEHRGRARELLSRRS